MRGLAILAGLLLLVGVGCLDGSSQQETQTLSEEPTQDPSNPDESEGEEIEQTADPRPDRFARPPAWIPGEYWTVEVDSTLMEEPVRWTRVVAGWTGDAYLVGQPTENPSTAGLLLHIPGLGVVAENNLSYSVHGSTFTPVQFPLEEGQEWQTSFEGDPVNASAEITGEVARLHFCCSRNITATYDPGIGAITQMTVDDGFLEYEVLDHGYGFQGTVDVPVERQIVFLQGRLAGALGAQDGPAGPVGQAEVPEEVDRVAFTQIVGSLDATPAPETGVYLEQATLPNGTSYATKQAASTQGLEISFHEAMNASGTWRFEHAAGGPGLAFTEGIGYQLVQRTLG